MAFSIDGNGRLKDGATAVPFVKSIFTGGAFPAGHPKIVVMHFTAGASAASSANWFKDPNNPGSSAHVVIDRDGSIIQCVTFDTVAFHAGKSTWKSLNGLNRFAFGIEMANWGDLRQTPSGWVTSSGKKIANPVLAIHRNGNPNGSPSPIGWEPYPKAQVDTAKALVRLLIEKFAIQEIVGHDDISVGRKWDPGPAFDMAGFRTSLLESHDSSGSNVLIVNSADGLNLRRGPGTEFEVIKLLPNGARVTPLEQNGNWALVNELKADGTPTLSGWAHRAFLVDA